MSLVGPRPGCGLRRLCENLENGRSTFLGRRTEELAAFVAFLPCNPLLVNILPATLVASIFCRDFRLSPPIISIFYRGRGGGRGTPAQPLSWARLDPPQIFDQ